MDEFTKWLNGAGGAILWQKYNRKMECEHAFAGLPGMVQRCTGCGYVWNPIPTDDRIAVSETQIPFTEEIGRSADYVWRNRKGWTVVSA